MTEYKMQEFGPDCEQNCQPCNGCIDEFMKGMNCRSTGTPCDYPDNDGHYSCPFDANGGDDCRNFCGLGVDE